MIFAILAISTISETFKSFTSGEGDFGLRVSIFAITRIEVFRSGDAKVDFGRGGVFR